jgi:hypothetical protein
MEGKTDSDVELFRRSWIRRGGRSALFSEIGVRIGGVGFHL